MADIATGKPVVYFAVPVAGDGWKKSIGAEDLNKAVLEQVSLVSGSFERYVLDFTADDEYRDTFLNNLNESCRNDVAASSFEMWFSSEISVFILGVTLNDCSMSVTEINKRLSGEKCRELQKNMFDFLESCAKNDCRHDYFLYSSSASGLMTKTSIKEAGCSPDVHMKRGDKKVYSFLVLENASFSAGTRSILEATIQQERWNGKTNGNEALTEPEDIFLSSGLAAVYSGTGCNRERLLCEIVEAMCWMTSVSDGNDYVKGLENERFYSRTELREVKKTESLCSERMLQSQISASSSSAEKRKLEQWMRNVGFYDLCRVTVKICSDISDEDRDRRDRRVGTMLNVVALLAVFSCVWDAVSLFLNDNKPEITLPIGIATAVFIGIVLVLSVLLPFIRSVRGSGRKWFCKVRRDFARFLKSLI